jgi:hypothetical protein
LYHEKVYLLFDVPYYFGCRRRRRIFQLVDLIQFSNLSYSHLSKAVAKKGFKLLKEDNEDLQTISEFLFANQERKNI